MASLRRVVTGVKVAPADMKHLARPMRGFRRDPAVPLSEAGMSWRKIEAELGVTVTAVVEACRATENRVILWLMGIDSPLDQAEMILAHEDRQRSPAERTWRAVASFGSVVAATSAALAAGNPAEAILKFSEATKKFSDALADDNSSYLLTIVVGEVRWLGERFEELSAEHRRFLNSDWITLLVDADRKAREARTREKVKRLGLILCNAAQTDPSPESEQIEEMLRIGMHLDDADVAVLGEAVRIQGHLIKPGRGKPTQWEAMNSWKGGNWCGLSLTDGELDSICGKLQSFGLLVRLDQAENQNVHAVVPSNYLLLKRGADFVTWVRARPETRVPSS